MAKKQNIIVSLIKDWVGTIFVALTVAIIFRSFAFASFYIPSESMVPTLEVGDRLFVNKFAYGYSKFSFPLSKYLSSFPTENGRVLYSAPKRGDVIVFSNPRDNVTTIKRLVGLPGDTIQIYAGRLYINGQVVQRKLVKPYSYKEYEGGVVYVHEYKERLRQGQTHKIIEQSDNYRADYTPKYKVPAGHVFLMGDNRDNSTDSRFISHLGYVPIENLIGRAEIISFSTYTCKEQAGLRCGARRFFEKIQ